MRLFEFADAESQMELWKLITDSVWHAIAKQVQEQKKLDAQSTKSTSAAPKQAKSFKPKFVSPQPSKTKKTSAQEIQRQKVQSKTLKTVPQTTSAPSSSVASGGAQNALKTKSHKHVPQDSNSVASIQRKHDPLSLDPNVKKLTM